MVLALKAVNISKNYRKNIVLNHFNMNVYQGDIYGFVGKNGAGKSTFLKILFGLIYANNGEISLFGSQNYRELTQKRELLSGIIEMPSFYSHLSAYENLKAYCLLRGIDNRKIEPSLDRVGLSNVGRKKVGKFSLGMKQRLGIARAICGNASLIVLDEPTNGLDPEGIVSFRELITELNKEMGITFIISSHYITELQKISSRIGLLADGKMLEELSTDELAKKAGVSVNITVSDADRASKILLDIYPNSKLSVKNKMLSIETDISTAKLIKSFSKQGIEVQDITSKSSNIEDYILNVISR